MKLEECGIRDSDAENVCYLRNLADAMRLVDTMQNSAGGNAVVIGGGYIGMECAAALVTNRIKVTMVFPEPHCSKCLVDFTLSLCFLTYLLLIPVLLCIWIRSLFVHFYSGPSVYAKNCRFLRELLRFQGNYFCKRNCSFII